YSTGLDHGTMVPLWYLREAGWQGKVVCIRIGGLPPRQCYEIGKVLRDAAEGIVALIASGDLSHCLSVDGPSPYNPAGADFDQRIAAALEKSDYQAVL
ncbi:MAG TPA: extradiol ring-cleavage dioxygenase, partial [Firmicutes bacterium]|nr:extradiol ring-cleavage dioxygenase [Bacillota bacterium]